MKMMLEEAEKLEPYLIQFRRDLHRFPELSFQESETAQKVMNELKKLGMEVKTQVGGHGIVADLEGKQPGPTIALRADMDALPIQEETGLPYASSFNGVMHACGHDAHTTILLGAAHLLVTHKDMLTGTVRFIFQSAEEINAGAKLMIKEGALDGVDEIYGLHNLPTCRSGMVATRHGSLMGSVDRIEIELQGIGGHGAIPDQSIDPVIAASAIIMGLQTAVSREVSPFEPVVITIGSLNSGHANNVIPHRAQLTGTVRTFSSDVQKKMEERIQRIAGQIATAYRCKMTLKYIKQVPVLCSSDPCVDYVNCIADDLIGGENRIKADPTLAGEDFSIYLNHVPGCFFWLGSGPESGAEQAYGLHHPQFDINESCLKTGAALLTVISLKRGKELVNE